jgi:L-serine dehydratase
MPLLIVEHNDLPGEIAAVTRIISGSGANIAQMRVSRTRKGADALMLIETDTALPEATLAEIEALPGVLRIRAVPAV